MNGKTKLLSALLCLSLTTATWAQNYPNKPIKLIVPFPAAGATDIFARVLSQQLALTLKTPVIVDNSPGAGGAIGSTMAAKAAADGYTLLLGTSSTHAIGPSLNPRTPYDAQRDFTPIAQVGSAPNILLIPNNAPTKNLADWITYARKQDGKLNYASSGNGTITHLTAAQFNAQAHISLLHIPYKGTALAITDLATGKVDFMVDSLTTGLPHVRSGRLTALAVTSAQRSPLAPDIPTVAEVLPGFSSVVWFGLFAPKGLPPALVQQLNTAINQVLREPAVTAKLATLGIEPVHTTAAEFATMVRQDTVHWKKVITDNHITLD